MKQYLKFILFFIFFIEGATSTFYAQQDSSQSKISFALRGKFLVALGWEDMSWRMYSIGTELIYNNHHCLGFDAGVFRSFRQYDDEFDNPIDDYTDRRSYFLVDYKYCFPINDEWSIYLNSYSKFNGKYTSKLHTYISDESAIAFDQLYAKGVYADLGVGAGFKVYFGFSNAGFDASINVGKRFESYDVYSYDEDNVQSINKHVSDDRTIMYLRINFFYHFFRRF